MRVGDMMVNVGKERPNEDPRRVILSALPFFLFILAVVVTFNVLNGRAHMSALEDSVKSQLIAISVAAREDLDIGAFQAYQTKADLLGDQPRYDDVLAKLRTLKKSADVGSIYVLKLIDGVPRYIYDTDSEYDTRFEEYPLSPVHEAAFAGKNSAGVMNVVDESGSLNTGAAPIWQDGKVIGVIATDMPDAAIRRSINQSIRGTILLAAVLALIMGGALFAFLRLAKNASATQRRLQALALNDTVTGLPNRQYLLDFLASMIEKSPDDPFALVFIDIDNFKNVNDRAGHDAGDELLRTIAKYIEGASANVKAFRPAPGMLNIAARIGGDEFIQVVRGVSTIAQAEKAARDLLANFASCVTDRYIEQYGVGLSIGVALYPYHTRNFHVLIKYADIAMYNAKHGGKNNYRVYDDAMTQEAR